MTTRPERRTAPTYLWLLSLLVASHAGFACTRERAVAATDAGSGQSTATWPAGMPTATASAVQTGTTSQNPNGGTGVPTATATNASSSTSQEMSSSTQTASSETSTSSQEQGPGDDTTTGEVEKPACKDGDEMTCEEDEAGNKIAFPGGVAQGSCRLGKRTCQAGEWSACVGAIAPKAKDTCDLGNDDNCNGIPTDHCNCSVGETQKCGSDVGACRSGLLRCQDDGTWGKTCEGEIKAKKEICDGLADENCDGKSDEENCECINGRTKPCGKHTLGACRQGTQTCSNGTWGSCIGEIRPATELCDGRGIDEDCDGRADLQDRDCDCINGRRKGCRIFAAIGDCALGETQCNQGHWGRCTPRFPRMTEVCGTLTHSDDALLGKRTGDEDCDGKVDESDVSNDFMPGDPLREGQLYMLDEDGDGWGAIGRRKSDVYRRYCNSRIHEVPEGFVREIPGQAGKDCGDCPGTGAIVNPGFSGDYQDRPNACLEKIRWRGGTYDYNCRGGEEKKFLATGVCSIETLGDQCRVPAGGVWDGVSSPPACGERTAWLRPEDCEPGISDDGKEICRINSLVAHLNTQVCK